MHCNIIIRDTVGGIHSEVYGLITLGLQGRNDQDYSDGP